MPNQEERERIWRVQLHARKTPLAEDVDFHSLAERFPRSGGDIKNAVLKAAQIATTEPGPDADKRIHQRHFIQGMEEVVAAQAVMSQSLFTRSGDGRVVPATPASQEAQLLEEFVGAQGQLVKRLAWLAMGAAALAVAALIVSILR